MKVTLAQISPSLGDVDANSQRIIVEIEQSKSDMIVFPELCLVGYPPTDMLEAPSEQTRINDAINKITAVTVGRDQLVVLGVPVHEAGAWYNSVVCISDGQVLHRYDKQLLPNYDIFNEARYFSVGKQSPIFKWKNQTVGVVICEDIWFAPERHALDPCAAFDGVALDLVVHVAASPFEKDKVNERTQRLQALQSRVGCHVVSVNQVGAYSEVIFDGGSMVLAASGEVYQSDLFKEVIEDINLDHINAVDVDETVVSKIESALIFGLQEYMKRAGIRGCVVGVSGGIDSAVVAALAVKALGVDRVRLVSMPTQYNSDETQMDAKMLSQQLGVVIQECSIESLRQQATKDIESVIGTVVEGVTHQNIQARLRGLILMAIANNEGSVLLTTGNKSELAMGYATLYGDMCGGLNIIGDLFKSEVYALAEHLNRDQVMIPKSIIEREPSAELAVGQKDSDSLPSYEVLDHILEQHMIEKKPLNELLKMNDNSDVMLVLNRLKQSEFKRAQSPPILKVSSKAFGVGWQFPIVR